MIFAPRAFSRAADVFRVGRVRARGVACVRFSRLRLILRHPYEIKGPGTYVPTARPLKCADTPLQIWGHL